MDENNEEKSRAEKRARSEAKRLQAIRAKAELNASRDRVVGLGLKEVDNEKKRRKITFDSESEDEREKSTRKRMKKLEDNELISNGTKKQSKLFGSDEEEEEGEIVFQNRHKGEKGIKLMQQEARYGNDQRFKLNDKFEDSEEEVEEDNLDDEKKELLGEKEGALSVLARVLGKEVKREKPSKEKKSKARPFTRFDPDNEEHVKWMRENTKKTEYVEEKKEEKKIDDEDKEKEIPQVYKKIAVEGRFFEMGGDFAKELKEKLEGKKSDEPFSFLASIGREEMKMTEKKSEPSDEELEMKEEDRQRAKCTIEEDPIGFESSSSGFFFDVFSLSARSVVSNFRRTQSIEKVKEKWSEQRESIIKTYKNQRRFAVKNVRDEKKGYGKKEGGMFRKSEEVDNGKKDKAQKAPQ